MFTRKHAMTNTARTPAPALFAALMLVVHPVSHACDSRVPTPETSPGPHDYSFAPAKNALWRDGDRGEPLLLHARVLDVCGKPVAGARIQVLHANRDGDHEPDRWRAVLSADDRGEFKLVTVYPGYAGSIARHIHFVVSHADHRTLVTRLFFRNDPAADQSVEELTVVLDEVRRGDVTGWTGGYEFVLPPK
jgi:protocatechuate 3,4-dioxygenase beta subunit